MHDFKDMEHEFQNRKKEAMKPTKDGWPPVACIARDADYERSVIFNGQSFTAFGIIQAEAIAAELHNAWVSTNQGG